MTVPSADPERAEAMPAPSGRHQVQARRITAISGPADPAILSTITAADIPPNLHPGDPPGHDQCLGQYL
jgi:hypothetical protein